MIILYEVAEKLSAILNGTDTETNPSNLYVPDYQYLVATQGFHLDKISDRSTGKNVIPVFISSMGGQFNPVKGLKQATYTIPIVFYFPVRFKDDFFKLGDFLVDVFVGSYLTYGTFSGKAVSNISVPQYGEIQDLDLREFKEWVGSTFKKEIDVHEPYLSMQISLYLSNAASGLIFGNNVTTSFSFTYNNTTYTLDDVEVDGISIQSNSQPQSEQEEETNESSSIPYGTSYGSSFKIYPNLEVEAKESTTQTKIYFYKELLKAWLNGGAQEISCQISFKIAGDSDLTYTRKCFIQSIILPIEKGQLLSLTLTFAKIIEFETEE